jgi:hypothetical protein
MQPRRAWSDVTNAMRATATLALEPRLQSRDEMNASFGGGQITAHAGGGHRRPTPSCRYRAVGPSRALVHRRSLLFPRHGCRSQQRQQRSSTTVSGIAIRSITRAARAGLPPGLRALFPPYARCFCGACARRCVIQTGLGGFCGWAILSHGEDEPHIARGLLYTLKRPMHEPI